MLLSSVTSFVKSVFDTDEPEDKLRRWADEEKGQLAGNAWSSAGSAGLTDTVRRLGVGVEGIAEVNDEVAFATRQLDDDSLTEEEKERIVADLIARKTLEAKLEETYGVNLTNDKGGVDEKGMPTARRHWSVDELEEMVTVFERLPPGFLDSPNLQEIRRAAMEHDWNGEWQPDEDGMGAQTVEDGTIRIFDAAMDHPDDFGRAGDSSDMAGMKRITPFEETLFHEVCHLHDTNVSPQARAVALAAGMRTELGGAFEARLEKAIAEAESAGDHERAEKIRQSLATFNLEEPVLGAGRMHSKYDGPTFSYVDGILPHSGAHSPGGGTSEDVYEYAASSMNEFVCDTATYAALAPELTEKDFIKAPALDVARLGPDADPEEIAFARKRQAALAATHAELRTFLGLEDWEVVEAGIDLGAKAEAMGLDDRARRQILADFHARAATAMTEWQLTALTESYEDELADWEARPWRDEAQDSPEPEDDDEIVLLDDEDEIVLLDDEAGE